MARVTCANVDKLDSSSSPNLAVIPSCDNFVNGFGLNKLVVVIHLIFGLDFTAAQGTGMRPVGCTLRLGSEKSVVNLVVPALIALFLVIAKSRGGLAFTVRQSTSLAAIGLLGTVGNELLSLLLCAADFLVALFIIIFVLLKA